MPAVVTDPTVEALLLTVPDAARLLATSRSTIYRLLATGDLAGKKQRARTLITMASLRAYADGLPPVVVTYADIPLYRPKRVA